MALDRWIALIIALVFLIYGHTAFFGMDDLLPPILKRNPIWPIDLSQDFVDRWGSGCHYRPAEF